MLEVHGSLTPVIGSDGSLTPVIGSGSLTSVIGSGSLTPVIGSAIRASGSRTPVRTLLLECPMNGQTSDAGGSNA